MTSANKDTPSHWKDDIARSVDAYNDWFMDFVPDAYLSMREKTAERVRKTLEVTRNLAHVSAPLLKNNPSVLQTLRMLTCPPLAVDRLIGLSGASRTLVKAMEKGKLPTRISAQALDQELGKIITIIEKMIDSDIFVWRERGDTPSELELYRAAIIVADRLCGALANPVIRNEQERRQLALIRKWLEENGYSPANEGARYNELQRGTFSFRLNVPVNHGGDGKQINFPVDAVVMPKTAGAKEFPLLIEAKSAGDFANVNKRRKEEAVKINQLRGTYGQGVRFILFLSGYFDSGYLGYEAAEGIDWVWQHRISDLSKLGL